ncbi:MAG: heme-binding protein [Rhodospirillales bacterium]
MAFAKTHRLTNAGAKKMMAAALKKAGEHGVAVTVVIVDGGGHPILVERMDGGRFHTVHSSMTKAVCASSNKRPTTSKGAVAQDLDTLHAVGLALAAGPERWTAMEGGMPVIFEGECVGGIGVSGGNWEADQEIARIAVEAIGAQTTI